MTAAEVAALDTLSSHYETGVPLADFPTAVVEGLLVQGLAVIRGGSLFATPEGAEEALDRLGRRLSSRFN